MLLMLEKLFSSVGVFGAAGHRIGELRLDAVTLDGVLRFELTCN